MRRYAPLKHTHPPEEISGIAVTWDNVTDKPDTATMWPNWSQVTGKPDLFPPATHGHTIDWITGLQDALDGKEPAFIKNSAFNKNFGTGLDEVARGSHLHDDRYSLLGHNHTGEYAPLAHTHDWFDLSGVPATASRWPAWDEVTGKPTSFPTTDHTHTLDDLLDYGGTPVGWNEAEWNINEWSEYDATGSGPYYISSDGTGWVRQVGVPWDDIVATGTPSASTYLRGDGSWAAVPAGITDHGALTGLADDDHTQYFNQTRGDARYSQLGHTHAIANVTGLQSALDGKLGVSATAADSNLLDGIDSTRFVFGSNGYATSDGRTDLNTLAKTGHYWASSATNKPNTENGTVLHINHDGGTQYATQLFLAHDGTRGAYFRAKDLGTWQAWKELSVVGHTHSYLPLSGGTLTGALNLNANLNYSNMYPTDGSEVDSLSSMPFSSYAMLKGIMANRTWFFPVAKIDIEVDNGSGWVDAGWTDAQKKDLVAGDAVNSSGQIPNGCDGFRITFTADTYVYVSDLYMYLSTQSNNLKVNVYRRNYSTQVWELLQAGSEVVNGWPCHYHMHHGTVPWHPSNHSDAVRVEIVPHNGTWSNANNVPLYRLQWWGSYPASKQELYNWDADQNVSFPARLTVGGDLAANGEYIYGDSKEIIRFSDAWLRLNQAGDFTSGIYCGNSILRTDNTLQVGSSGASFSASPSAASFFTKLAIDTNGCVSPASTSFVDAGMYGNYSSTRKGHIWSIGPAYRIAADGSSFGSLYGLGYQYDATDGHQIVYCNNGSVNARISLTDGDAWIGTLRGGTVPLARLDATGTPSASTFLRGDGTWATPSASVSALGDIGDVTLTSIGIGEVLYWNGSGWINRTLAEAGIAALTHTHSQFLTNTTDTFTGTLTVSGAIDIDSSDTTLDRKAAGVLSVENRAVVTHASTSYTSAEITFSTANPSGGASGDIWFKYS